MWRKKNGGNFICNLRDRESRKGTKDRVLPKQQHPHHWRRQPSLEKTIFVSVSNFELVGERESK